MGVVEQIPLNGPEYIISVSFGEPMESFREDPELDKRARFTILQSRITSQERSEEEWGATRG